MSKTNASTIPLAKRVAAGAIGAVLSFSMTIPFGATQAIAAESGATGEKSVAHGASTAPTAKREVVYTKTDATGASGGSYVVNAFETPDKVDIKDPGTYKKVTNLTSSKKLEQRDGSVDLTTVAGEPFYYQGNLSKDTKLPWTVQITYRLDGKVVKPSELAGKDGRLDIELKVDGLGDDSATADFAKSFLLQAQGTFPNQNFKLDSATNATVATSGSNTVLTYVLIPGQNGDWHITGDAHDFAYDGWQIAAMPLDLSLDTSKIDTSGLTSATARLQDGIGRLDAGGARLRDALGLLSNGAGQAAAGAGALSTGADQLAAGAGAAKAGTGKLAAGAGALATGSASLSGGNARLAAGARQLSQGAGALRDTLRSQGGTFDRLDSGAKQVSGGTQQLYQALSATLPQQLLTVNQGLSQTRATLDGIQQKLEGIKSQAGSMSTAAQGAISQAQAVRDDLTTIEQGAGGLTTALQEAGTSAGTAQAEATGSKQAADGAKQSADAAAASADSASQQLDALLADASLTADQRAKVQAADDQAKAAEKGATTASGYAATASTYAGKAADDSGSALATIKGLGTSLQGMQTAGAKLQKDAEALKGTLSQMQGGIKDVTGESADVLASSQKALDGSQALVGKTQQQLGAIDLGQLKQLADGAAQVSSGVSALVGSLKATSGTSTIGGAVSGIASGTSQLDGGAAAAASGASQVAGGASQLKGGLDTLDSGATKLDGGAARLASGARTLDGGLKTLASGAPQAQDGSATLADGLDTLRSSTDGIDQKVIDKLEETIKEKLGQDYQLHSFVDPSNTNVSEVQFVYVVDGVKEAKSTGEKGDGSKGSSKSESKGGDATKSESFIDRLGALFSADKRKSE